MFKKLWKESSGLAWTLGGTGLVLITLSGSTRDLGVVISVVSFIWQESLRLMTTNEVALDHDESGQIHTY